ncbi:At1g47710 [Linum perenne]
MDFSIRVAMATILDQLNDGNARNVVVSPASLDIVLRTVACGAKSETLEQMLSFLGAQDIDELNSKASSTMEVFRLASPDNNPPPPVVPVKSTTNVPANVSCANAIWIDEQYSVKDSFKKLLNEVYRAEAKNVDFLNKKEEAVKKINSWAEKSTNGCINNILNPDDIEENTKLVLTNAIYFKAQWSNRFEECKEGEDFHLIDGINKLSNVTFMERYSTRFRFGKFDKFNVLELPYESGIEGPCFAMYIFLPHKVDGLPEMVSKFSESNSNSNPIEALSQTLGGLEYVEMKKVVIPKWKSSNRLKLKDMMKNLGLESPFETNRSDFTEMIEGGNVYIGDVIQNAYIDVDEKGTEAAAVVSVDYWEMCCCEPPEIPVEEFVADHPFMFMIVERDSKAVIFAGAVFNPLDQ